MLVAYKVPLSAECQDEFDSLDLRGTKKLDVSCSLGCDTTYVLIYPAEMSQRDLDHYRRTVLWGMRNCHRHPPKIKLAMDSIRD